MPARRGRPPAAAPKLHREAIVSAGLATVRAEGLDGLTMGRVAERIGVRSASLYWHVRHKEELLDLLAEAIFDGAELAGHVDPTDRRASLAAIIRAMRRIMLAHRDSARLLAGRFGTGQGQLRHAELILGLLRGAGLSDRDAAYALFLLMTFLIGFVGGEQAPLSAAVATGQDARSYLDELRDRLTELPPDRFPNTVALATDLTAPDLDSRFEFALDRLLDGIAALPHGA